MGTRADFYMGRDAAAEWLGSIAWDGMDIPDEIREAKTAEEYRQAVAEFLSGRDDATLPEMGWPWPWDDSGTTDCSYWFFEGRTWEEDDGHYASARPWRGDRIEYPDMSARKNVTLGARSGVIVVGR